MSVILYTQPNCPYCDLMKSMLDETNIKYRTIDIKENGAARDFIIKNGHKTVPQLYYGSIHLNKKVDTRDYTPQELYDIIEDATKSEWPWQDSGIEDFR